MKARSFEPLRTAVLNVWPSLVVFVKQNVIELAHVDHLAALLALVKMLFFSVASLSKSAAFIVYPVQKSSMKCWPDRVACVNQFML